MTRKVIFVAPKKTKRVVGSTLLRSGQLWQLAEPLLKAEGILSFVGSRDDFRDAVLVLNKNILLKLNPESIERLKKRGNIVCADPLDGKYPEDVLSSCDVLIAASKFQFADYSRRFPTHRVSYVGHHVDLRIGKIAPPNDRIRIGYFGEPLNTRFEDDFRDRVSFVRVNTSNANKSPWIDELSSYNAHYAIRASRPIDGFKPFTKGFVAAHCNCPILVETQDEEARQFLPADYPFFTDASSAIQVRETIERMEQSFGGAEWRRALDAMRDVGAASARDRVARQVFDLVSPEVATPIAKTSPIMSFARRIARRVKR
jgi:hypothetical protein